MYDDENSKLSSPLVAETSEKRRHGGTCDGVWVAYLSPLVFGVALGVGYGNIGGVIASDAFKRYYGGPSDSILELLAGVMAAGCVLGSFVAGYIADRYGRVPSMCAASVLLLCGSLLCSAPMVFAFVPLWIVFVGRTLVGISGGMLCVIVPIYVSEVSPADSRGAIESSFQVAIEFGILGAYVASYATIPHFAWGWKFTLCLQSVVSVPTVLLACSGLLPESPRWLALFKDRIDAAKRSLLRCGSSASDARSAMSDLQRRSGQADPSLIGSLRDKTTRRGVLVALAVCTLQVGTAIDVATVYAPDIFSQGSSADDVSESRKLLYTCLVGLTFFFVTPLTVAFVDRVGRRPLLLAGATGMSVSLFALSVFVDRNTPSSIAALLLFVFSFSFSWGPIGWIVPSEIVHSSLRARVISAGTVLNWFADYLVISTFLSLKRELGESGVFCFYAVINTLAVAFVYLCVPETKGHKLDAAG